MPHDLRLDELIEQSRRARAKAAAVCRQAQEIQRALRTQRERTVDRQEAWRRPLAWRLFQEGSIFDPRAGSR